MRRLCDASDGLWNKIYSVAEDHQPGISSSQSRPVPGWHGMLPSAFFSSFLFPFFLFAPRENMQRRGRLCVAAPRNRSEKGEQERREGEKSAWYLALACHQRWIPRSPLANDHQRIVTQSSTSILSSKALPVGVVHNYTGSRALTKILQDHMVLRENPSARYALRLTCPTYYCASLY
jgi:hypothetical protein